MFYLKRGITECIDVRIITLFWYNIRTFIDSHLLDIHSGWSKTCIRNYYNNGIGFYLKRGIGITNALILIRIITLFWYNIRTFINSHLLDIHSGWSKTCIRNNYNNGIGFYLKRKIMECIDLRIITLFWYNIRMFIDSHLLDIHMYTE